MADIVEFTFSSHRFSDWQGTLTRKKGKTGIFGRYYYASDTGTDWHFDLSLHMYYRKYPRKIFFRVEPK